MTAPQTSICQELPIRRFVGSLSSPLASAAAGEGFQPRSQQLAVDKLDEKVVCNDIERTHHHAFIVHAAQHDDKQAAHASHASRAWRAWRASLADQTRHVDAGDRGHPSVEDHRLWRRARKRLEERTRLRKVTQPEAAALQAGGLMSRRGATGVGKVGLQGRAVWRRTGVGNVPKINGLLGVDSRVPGLAPGVTATPSTARWNVHAARDCEPAAHHVQPTMQRWLGCEAVGQNVTE